MTDLNWIILFTEPIVLSPIICHKDNVDLIKKSIIITDVEANFIFKETPSKEIHFDFGGMVHVDEPTMEFSLDENSNLKIFTWQVSSLAHLLEETLGESENIIFIHGFLRVLAMTRLERSNLLDQVKERLPEALAIESILNEDFNTKMVKSKLVAAKERPVHHKKIAS